MDLPAIFAMLEMRPHHGQLDFMVPSGLGADRLELLRASILTSASPPGGLNTTGRDCKAGAEGIGERLAIGFRFPGITLCA